MRKPALSVADLASIAAGGVAGALLRWLITKQDDATDTWFTYEPNSSVTFAPVEFTLPIATLMVNLFGCLLLGALTLMLRRAVPISRRLLVAAATGFCGSLTTFSAFAVEMARMMRGFPVLTQQPASYPRDYEVAFGTALTYLVLSVGGGALAFGLGRYAAQRVDDSDGKPAIGVGQ